MTRAILGTPAHKGRRVRLVPQVLLDQQAQPGLLVPQVPQVLKDQPGCRARLARPELRDLQARRAIREIPGRKDQPVQLELKGRPVLLDLLVRTAKTVPMGPPVLPDLKALQVLRGRKA